MRIDELPRSKKIEDRRAVRMRAGGIGIGTLVTLATTASLTSIGRRSHKRLSTRYHGGSKPHGCSGGKCPSRE